MEFLPVFFEVGPQHYRVHFPYLLPNFEPAMLQKEVGKRFDSDERHYEIIGYSYGPATYDIRVVEIGSDLAPARIESWFYSGGVKVDLPADLRGMIRMRNEEATKLHMLVYVNDKGLS